ncbi:hypothetical protein M885DRAFT_615177 [Pelagophyceae sp. CCMP2097]|nr:hypothetical protein M885DRAFT_615177 [Pelagophyceae sp. CCMP2097]
MSKLRPMRDQPWPLSASGLQIIDSTISANLEARAPRRRGPALSFRFRFRVEARAAAPQPRPRGPAGPASRICHLCGTPQLLRTGSFPQHFKRCAAAWQLEEDAKPVSSRRPRPQAPLLADGSAPTAKTSRAALENFNREAMRVWKRQTLAQCPNCDRSFRATSLVQHLKGCHSKTETFLGAPFVSVATSNIWHKPQSTAYPTVEESMTLDAKSRRNQSIISHAAPLKLDEQRVAARRSVPSLAELKASWAARSKPPRRKPPAAPAPEDRRPEARAGASEPSIGFTWGARTSTKAAKRLAEVRTRESAAERAGDAAAQRAAPRPSPREPTAGQRDLQARLDALEKSALATHESLKRIERHFRDPNAPPPPPRRDEAPRRPRSASPPRPRSEAPFVEAAGRRSRRGEAGGRPHSRSTLSKEHEKYFTSGIVFAWED